MSPIQTQSTWNGKTLEWDGTEGAAAHGQVAEDINHGFQSALHWESSSMLQDQCLPNLQSTYSHGHRTLNWAEEKKHHTLWREGGLKQQNAPGQYMHAQQAGWFQTRLVKGL